MDDEGRMVGILIGETPTSHPAIRAVLGKKSRRTWRDPAHRAHLDPNKFAIIASSDPEKEGQLYEYPNPPESAVLATAHASPSPWTIVIDQNAKEALAGIKSLTNCLRVLALFLRSSPWEACCSFCEVSRGRSKS